MLSHGEPSLQSHPSNNSTVTVTINLRFNSSASCQAGGKYWKNSDWYLGKHLAAMGVQVQS